MKDFKSNIYLEQSRPLNSHGFTMCHTVLLLFSRSHGRFFISHDFTNIAWIFSQTYSFLKEQKQVAYSNVAEKRISSMINQNNPSSRSSLSLSWELLFIILVNTHIDNPFPRKPSSK